MKLNPLEHLTENEFTQYVLEDLPEDLEEEIDEHIESCVICAKELETYYTAQDNFPHQQWAAERDTFVETLRNRIFKRTLADVLQWFLLNWQRQPLGQTSAPSLTQIETIYSTRCLYDGGFLTCEIFRDPNEGLTYSFTSTNLSEEGKRVILHFDGEEKDREGTFERWSETEVIAQIEIPHNQLPLNIQQFSIEVEN